MKIITRKMFIVLIRIYLKKLAHMIIEADRFEIYRVGKKTEDLGRLKVVVSLEAEFLFLRGPQSFLLN